MSTRACAGRETARRGARQRRGGRVGGRLTRMEEQLNRYGWKSFPINLNARDNKQERAYY
jgi:hypothetical protein